MTTKSITQKAFRFSRATCDNLHELVTLGIVRNETEAIDLAIMHFLVEKKTEARFKNINTNKEAPGGIIPGNDLDPP